VTDSFALGTVDCSAITAEPSASSRFELVRTRLKYTKSYMFFVFVAEKF